MTNEIVWFKNISVDEKIAKLLTDKSLAGGHSGNVSTNCEITSIPAKGNIIDFPAGVDSYVFTYDASDLDSANAISIGVWLYKRDNGSCMVVDRNNTYRLWFADSSNRPTFAIYIAGSWQFATSSFVIPVDEWVFVTGSWDGTDLKVFISGIEKASVAQAGSISDSVEPIYLGRYHYGGLQLNGMISEVIIRNVATDLAQHKIDLNAGMPQIESFVIELLDIEIGDTTHRLTSYHEAIDITV